MAWEQDVESWKVTGKTMCHRNSILFHFEIIREKLRDASHEHECNPKQGECSCYGAAAALGLQREFWRSASSVFPKMATLHHRIKPIYLGVAERPGTHPASANVLHIVNLHETAEIPKSLRQR